MPTTRPRYTITDTGAVSEMLDLAHERWPGVDRKQLLLRLTQTGCDAIARELQARDLGERRERQRAAISAIANLVDREVLLSDAAWE